MKVDLCCGHNCKDGYAGLDVKKWNSKVIFKVDLNKGKLPFYNNSIDAFYEQNSFYELNNPMEIIKECYRCLKPNGILEFKEMHFSSQYAFTPRTKNFWSFSTARLFTKGYRDCYSWELIELDFDTGFEETHPKVSKLFKSFINFIGFNTYEKYICRILPIFRVCFKFKKMVIL